MARYLDGFLIPIPKKNLRAYRKIAAIAGKVWMEKGALAYFEGLGDDLKTKGLMASFPSSARAKSGETVLFSWILYKSKAHRNRVNKEIMKDPRIIKMMKLAPIFDNKRMAYGGFKAIVDR